jgi:hypothetical protein
MLRTLIDWWANYAQVRIPGDRCTPNADGLHQAAMAAINPVDWMGAFNLVFMATAIAGAVVVLVTYESRLVGDAFWRRWWKFLPLAAVVCALASYFFLSQVRVNSILCENGDVLTTIPSEYVLGRTGVALVQGALFYVIFSVLLTLLARVWKRPVWYDKVKVPLPF